MPEGTPSPAHPPRGRDDQLRRRGKERRRSSHSSTSAASQSTLGQPRPAPRKPDWVCFDLDPVRGRFDDAVSAALLVQAKRSIRSKLVSFPKTSGGKGLHVFVPIRTGPRRGRRPRIRAPSRPAPVRGVSAPADDGVAHPRPPRGRLPRSVSQRLRPDRRRAVLVCNRPGAPVSTPLRWNEVGARLDPEAFTLARPFPACCAARIRGRGSSARGSRSRAPSRPSIVSERPPGTALNLQHWEGGGRQGAEPPLSRRNP